MRENPPALLPHGSIGSRGPPQRQHSVEPELIDRLRNTGLLDLPRDGAQTEGIERNGGGGTQERQVAEARAELVVAYRQIALDLLLGHQPSDRSFFVAELIDQLQLHRLPAGEDASVRNLFKLR